MKPESTLQPSLQAVVSGAKQLNKLKRFLTTLVQFSSDISLEISVCVKKLVLDLINSKISIEDFHHRLQETTNFPLRPFVIPFLKVNLPLLQQELLFFRQHNQALKNTCTIDVEFKQNDSLKRKTQTQMSPQPKAFKTEHSSLYTREPLFLPHLFSSASNIAVDCQLQNPLNQHTFKLENFASAISNAQRNYNQSLLNEDAYSHGFAGSSQGDSEPLAYETEHWNRMCRGEFTSADEKIDFWKKLKSKMPNRWEENKVNLYKNN